MDWEDIGFRTFMGSLIVGAAALIALGIFALCQDHTVKSYYVGDVRGCIYAEVNWDQDTYPKNYSINSDGDILELVGQEIYDAGNNYRVNSPGTFDAVINPQNVYPGNGMTNLVAGDRFLIIEDIGSTTNNIGNVPGDTNVGAIGWKNQDGTDLIAKANDIIEWTGNYWRIVFNSVSQAQTVQYVTNITTGVQYEWTGAEWIKSYQGVYPGGTWNLVL